MTHLIYVADPMCSWCYGFGPELQKILTTLPDASLEIVTGGLRAYEQEPLTLEKRNMILGHWKHVADASGLPFSEAGMMQAGFVYDTEPACRAVVTAKILADYLSGRQLLQIFHAIQHAFYAEGKNITQEALLSEITVSALNGIDDGAVFTASEFYETLTSAIAMADVRQEFAQCQQWGIRGFPALLLVHDHALHMVASGYTKADQVLQAIQQLQS